jgi:azurin
VTPAADFYGELSVNVKVNDGSLDSAVYELKIQVIGVNDAPVIAATELISVDEDSGWTLDASLITVVDSDSTDFTYTLQAGDHYTIEGDTVVMPEANYNGVLNVGVTVNDGHVDSAPSSIQITVNPVNDEPTLGNDTATVKADSSNNVINVLGNDSDVDEGDTITLESVAYTGTGSATVVGSNISYTPAAGFKGTETFEYTAKDSVGAVKTASVTVTVEDTSNNVQLGGGGSMSGFVYLMLLPLVAIRRRFKLKG